MNLFMRIIAKQLLAKPLRTFIRTLNRQNASDEVSADSVNHVLEWLYLAVCLLVGMAVVSFAIEGRVWGIYKTPGRILFIFP